MGANIGRVDLRVALLDKSPFSGQPKQERVIYFTADVFRSFTQVNCFALPAPINGIRLKENLDSYDNYLQDTKGNALEEASFIQEVAVFDGDTQQTQTRTVNIPADPSAAVRASDLVTPTTTMTTTTNPDTGKTTTTEAQTEQQKKQDGVQKEYFTWKTKKNLFKQADKNPDPPLFTEASLNNAPAWTYLSMDRPGSKSKSKVLAPFMRKCPPDSRSPVHWGVQKKVALAKNQPFEIMFYSCTRDPAIAKDAAPLDPVFQFVDLNDEPIDLGLTSALYFAIEMGSGTQYNYLMIFKNEEEPYFFRLTKGEGDSRKAVLFARFAGFNAAKLFDRNQRYFTISVEPVVSSLIIRSNAFAETPWLVLSQLNRPVFVGQGRIALYGGNIQGAFLMRPIQYEETGSFTTPETAFIIAEGKDKKKVVPECSFALKGEGEIEQDRSAKASGDADDADAAQSSQEVQMADAEEINGKKLVTIVEKDVADSNTEGITRTITSSIEEVPDPSGKPEKSDAKFDIVSRKYKTIIEMTPGDVPQPGGYVVKNGRSPYVWMERCSVDEDEGEAPQETVDISCDVMSVDLAWNATSYNEFSHTGTMKVLNNLQNGVNYRQYTNRAVYLIIEAGWAEGVGAKRGRIFEGLAVGYSVDTVAEREIVTFKIEDYMNALSHSKFQLSPFYDGMKASLAVRDIVKTIGLPDDKILTDDKPIKDANLKDDLGLSFSNPFEEPQFRFKNGTSLKEGILKIAKLDFKVVYFDQFGRFHYDNMPGGLYANRSFTLKATFFSSQKTGGTTPADLVWNSTSFSRLINDAFNAISIKTVSRRSLAWLALGHTYKSGIYDPDAEGYLGYSKKLFIEDSAIASVDGLGRYLSTLMRRVYIPPLTGRFETYGRPGLKPLDVITMDGQIMRIMNISMRLSAAENQFWMNVEGEWQFNVNKDQAPALNNPNAGGGGGQGGAGAASAR